MTCTVRGACESGYGRLADLLAERLEAGREVGASIGVYRDGQPVVEIWGGHTDRNRRRPWTGNTVTPLASTTKALATAAVLLLVDRGHLDLDRPIADYWPAFATAGKGEITTALVLAHRSGVPALDTAISNDDAAELDPILRAIEAQRPAWPPGSRHGYHAMTYGFILSGIVRVITGRTIGQYFADEIARPRHLDLHLGLAADEHDRVAPMIGPTGRDAVRALLTPMWFPYSVRLLCKKSLTYRATFGGSAAGFNSTAELTRYEVEDPSAGGVGTGPALARLFAALGGPVGGTRLVSADLMNRARISHASGRDQVLRMRTDWGLGFALQGGPMVPAFGVPGVFGHTGASGSIGFADPDHQLAFGYTPNYWGELSGRGRTTFRFTAYVEAAYAAAGIRRWPAQETS